jgi:hypothetical protein
VIRRSLQAFWPLPGAAAPLSRPGAVGCGRSRPASCWLIAWRGTAPLGAGMQGKEWPVPLAREIR